MVPQGIALMASVDGFSWSVIDADFLAAGMVKDRQEGEDVNILNLLWLHANAPRLFMCV